MHPDTHAHADAQFSATRNRLDALLRIPSVSTVPAHADDVRRAARWIADWMTEMGMTRAEIYEAEGRLPLVYGEWLGAGETAPTVLIYTHYDVQPADKSDGWDTEPFEPTERNGKLYARGAVDSKCHVVIQLAAIEALLKGGGAPVNLKVLCEGEEESGSEHIYAFVAQNPDLLRADVCVISDGSLPNEHQPVLDYGLRGIISFEIHVKGPRRDLHSGHYGGSVHNPIQALAEIVAQLHAPDGSVSVPGFYDQVAPFTDEERAVLAPMHAPFEQEWQDVTGAPAPWGEQGYSAHERIAVRPTLELNGIYGGYIGEGVKTVLPSTAVAKLSCRLVPYQTPDHVWECLHTHIHALTPPSVTVEVKRMEMGAEAFIIDRTSPALKAVTAAYEQGWGVKPLLSREGGSIPVTAEFQRYLSAQLVMMPFGYKNGGAHSINENCDLGMVQKGIHTMLHFYRALADG
ncbi:MAG: dipeptidase [Anaerolineae bacterium]|nr:dipeptidase [Anaerolineae bacterium]